MSSNLCRMCGYYQTTEYIECIGNSCIHCTKYWKEKVIEPYKKTQRERQEQEKVAAAIAAAREVVLQKKIIQEKK